MVQSKLYHGTVWTVTNCTMVQSVVQSENPKLLLGKRFGSPLSTHFQRNLSYRKFIRATLYTTVVGRASLPSPFIPNEIKKVECVGHFPNCTTPKLYHGTVWAGNLKTAPSRSGTSDVSMTGLMFVDPQLSSPLRNRFRSPGRKSAEF